MAAYAIGLDGGGTKTEIAMVNTLGETLYMGRLGPLNPVSYPTSASDIAAELARFLDDECVGISAACAGVGDEKMANSVREALGTVFTGPIFLRTDGQNSLYTALEDRAGVALISGTGSICYGQNGANTARSGGRGHVFDDAGSAYAMGRDILALVAHSLDGRAEKTALTELLFEHCKTDDFAAITARYTDPKCKKSDIALLSTLLDAAAGDGEARRIEHHAAEELALMATAVIKRLDIACPNVALMGGVFLNRPKLSAVTVELIREKHADAHCFLCDKSPAVGAAEYALKMI